MAIDSAYPDAAPIAAAHPAPTRFSRTEALALALMDASMLVLAVGCAVYVIEHAWSQALAFDRIALSAAICIVAWLALFYRFGLYRRSFAVSMRDEFYCTVTALVLGAFPLLFIFTVVPTISSSRAVLLLSLAFAVVTVGVSRAAAREVHVAIGRRRPRRIAIVGTRGRVQRAIAQMDVGDQPLLRLEVEDIEASVAEISVLADEELERIDWLRSARDWRCDMLVLTELLPPHVLPPLLRTASLERFTLAFAPPRLCAQAYEFQLDTGVGHQALIVPRQLYTFAHGARILKRAIDVCVALAILILAAPVMLLAAAAIVLEDGAPIFFRQERVGLFGRTFEILKFRSMYHDAEARSGAIWSPVDDPRITRVGKFLRRTSIDELPQLINVLRGDMSIVGPRPERPVFVERFRAILPRYEERHLVRPGITGWAQVNMERKLDPSQVGEKLSHDLWYIEHWGLFMDLSIVCKTAVEFLFHRA
jgi:exopolysaccharide biosynthesis polyprenyl glycosylphosphotransferase